MSLAPDTTLSTESREALHDLIWSIPQNELLTYAATGTALMGGGFRKNNIGVVRARVMQVVEGKEPIDDNLRRLLARHDPCASCLAVLSEETLRDNLEDLVILFGAPRLNLALLLDKRLAPLRQVESQKSKVDSHNPAAALRASLSPLLSALGATVTSASEPPDATSAARELRAEITRLKGAANRLEKETSNREKAEAAADKWRQKAEAAEKTIGPFRQRAEKAEADLARHTREAEAMANAKLEIRLASEFAEWLGGRRAAMLREVWPASADEVGSNKLQAAQPPATSGGTSRQQPQAALAADNLRQLRGPTAPLLARAAAAMDKQAQADLAAGTRCALETKLAAYEETLERCGALIADALRPSEDLLAVEKELAAEVRRIRQILHPEVEEETTASPEEALVRAVNLAADHELPDLRHMVNRMCDLKIVSDAAKARLDERIRNRYAALYAKRGGPGLESGDGASAEYILQCALEGQFPLIFLIDGHNTLYAIQSRYSRPQDHRGPPSEARDWLVNDIVQVFANAHNCRVIIVFDGPERTESNPAGNVKVVYSGGGGNDVEHRADDVLVDEARFLHEADPDMRMLLATNDNGLASRAASLGVRNVPPTALLAYLR